MQPNMRAVEKYEDMGRRLKEVKCRGTHVSLCVCVWVDARARVHLSSASQARAPHQNAPQQAGEEYEAAKKSAREANDRFSTLRRERHVRSWLVWMRTPAWWMGGRSGGVAVVGPQTPPP